MRAPSSPSSDDDDAIASPDDNSVAMGAPSSSSTAMTQIFSDQLSEKEAANFVEVSERRHQVVDVIGLGGALLSSVLFACPLLGVPVPSSVPLGLLIACLGIFFVGRPVVNRADLTRLRALGLSSLRAKSASNAYRKERALIRQGAMTTARQSRLARALLESANDETSLEPTGRPARK